jgi:hypothetical protein
MFTYTKRLDAHRSKGRVLGPVIIRGNKSSMSLENIYTNQNQDNKEC